MEVCFLCQKGSLLVVWQSSKTHQIFDVFGDRFQEVVLRKSGHKKGPIIRPSPIFSKTIVFRHIVGSITTTNKRQWYAAKEQNILFLQ